MRIRFWFCFLFLLHAFLLPGEAIASLVASSDTSPSYDVYLDNSTFQNLSLRVLFKEEIKGTVSISAAFCRKGTDEWRPALPLDFVWERNGTKLFAGSILNLCPGTTYEILLSLDFENGQSSSALVTATTRKTPEVALSGDGEVHVYPGNAVAPDGQMSYPDLHTAFTRAVAGEVVLLHAGTYTGPFHVSISGTSEKPIVFKNFGDGEVVLENPREQMGRIIHADQGCHHLHFEGVTFRKRGTKPVMTGEDNDGWVLRGCLILGSVMTGSNDWWITDNVFVGRYTQWRKRDRFPEVRPFD
ncbi:hypothetical protein ACFL0Q_00695 [Thermodesulfobacteriota bacterium]